MTKQFWANLALCVVLGALAIFGLSRVSTALTPKGLLVSDPRPSSAAAPLMSEVVLARYQVGEVQDHVIEADFVVRNGSARDVKNIKVLCEFYDDQGKYRDRKLWLLSTTVPAGEIMTVSSAGKRFVNSRARALECRISDFQVAGEPFFVLSRVTPAPHDAPGSGEGHGASTGH